MVQANTFAQENKIDDFDSVFNHIITSLITTDTDEAIRLADSLYTNAESNTNEIKSLMLLGNLHDFKGELIESLNKVLLAEGIARKWKEKDWEIRISLFLSNSFRNIGLYEYGVKYLNTADKRNNKESNIYQSFIHQEKAYYNIEEERYKEAIEEIKLSELEILKTPELEKTPLYLATSYYLLGESYLNLNQLDSAQLNYSKGLNIPIQEDSDLKGFIYTGLGKLEAQQQHYNEALNYYNKAEVISGNSKNLFLQSKLYKNLISYYSELEDTLNADKYNIKYLDLVKKQSELLKIFSNQAVVELNEEKIKTKSEYKIIIWGISGLLFLFSVIIIFNQIKFKKEKKQYEDVIKKIRASVPLDIKTSNNNQITPQKNGGISNSKEEDSKKEEIIETKLQSLMSLETEEELLMKLNKAEMNFFFLQTNVSLSRLASKINTNTKYLSYIINKHKRKDFNNYINELRVRYIIQKLEKEPKYLQYKIAALAEESGFSSHSKFTSVFKTVTGLTPSVFISYMKKDSNFNKKSKV